VKSLQELFWLLCLDWLLLVSMLELQDLELVQVLVMLVLEDQWDRDWELVSMLVGLEGKRMVVGVELGLLNWTVLVWEMLVGDEQMG